MSSTRFRSPRGFFLTFAAIGFSIFATACGNLNETANTSQPAPSNVVVNQPSPAVNVTNVPAETTDLSSVTMTLPIVDALLSDDTVTSQLKMKAQLTDEEVMKLKDAAHKFVMDLNEAGDDAGNRSTSAAAKDALAKIKEIVGPEKADSVMRFLKETWNGQDVAGGFTNATTSPGTSVSVPKDSRVVVNAPAYRMDVFKDGKLTKSYKVGIGYPEFPLPIGTRKATEIIFNPTWTPPDEPWVTGKAAPRQKGRGRQQRQSARPDKDTYRYAVAHSRRKIAVTSWLIRIARLRRFDELGHHGFCAELSAISGGSLTPDDIKGFQKDKTDTKTEKLPQTIPVEIRYDTIVATDDGKLTIYRDVYERGTNTEDNLKKVLEAAGVPFDSLPRINRQRCFRR